MASRCKWQIESMEEGCLLNMYSHSDAKWCDYLLVMLQTAGNQNVA